MASARADINLYGSGDLDRDIPLLATQIELGRLELAPLVSHRIGLDDVAGTFDRMRAAPARDPCSCSRLDPLSPELFG